MKQTKVLGGAWNFSINSKEYLVTVFDCIGAAHHVIIYSTKNFNLS